MDERHAVQVVGKRTAIPSGLAEGMRWEELPLRVDWDFAEFVRRRVGSLPPKRLRVLLLSNPIMKMQERMVLHFFNALKLARCDCYIWEQRPRSTRPRLRNIRYLARLNEAVVRGYDYVISFDSNLLLRAVCERVGARGVHLGGVRDEPAIDAGCASPPATSGPRIAVYSLKKSVLDVDDFRAGLGCEHVSIEAAIDFPPNVELYYQAPAAHRFPLAVLGGHDRDYRLIYELRGRFPHPVVVTAAEPRALSGPAAPDQRRYLALLCRDDRFRTLPHLSEERYLKVLLYSRVILVPFAGFIKEDSTCVADALWYGKPSLTNSVRATAHLDDRVTFFDGPEGLLAKLHELDDEDIHREAAERALKQARAKHDLYGLLCQLYSDL